MKLIEPSFEIIEQHPGLVGVFKKIELAGRNCYKSESKITEDSSTSFVDRMIKSDHKAMLEHATVYLKIAVNWDYYDHQDDVMYRAEIDFWFENQYSSVVTDCEYLYVTTNYRVIIENEKEDYLHDMCEPTEFHTRRYTVKFTTSNGIMREFTRHRRFSFAVESTRYCNYSKNKFNNSVTFIKPSYLRKDDDIFIDSLIRAEKDYFDLLEKGWPPQQARDVLPLATKCDMIMTGSDTEWINFFDLRCSFLAKTGKPHPDASYLADGLYMEFIKRNYIFDLNYEQKGN